MKQFFIIWAVILMLIGVVLGLKYVVVDIPDQDRAAKIRDSMHIPEDVEIQRFRPGSRFYYTNSDNTIRYFYVDSIGKVIEFIEKPKESE